MTRAAGKPMGPEHARATEAVLCKPAVRCRAGVTAPAAVVALCAAAPVLWPAQAWATSMDGLGVVVFAVFVGLPAGLVLLVLLVGAWWLGRCPRRPWHDAYAVATLVLTPLLLAAYPVVTALFTPSRFLGAALLFSLPLVALAVVAVLLALRLRRLGRAQAPAPRRADDT